MTALAATLVLAQLASTLSLSDRSEIRSRTVPDSNRRAIDTDTVPAATLALGARHSSYTLGYGARLAYLDVTQADTFTAVHTGRVAAAFWGSKLRITLAADGWIGRQSWVGLPPTIRLADAPPVPVAQASYVISPQVLDAASVRATASATYNVARRWTGVVNTYATVAGGFDYFDQRAFPPNRGWGGDVGASHAITRRETLSTRLRSTYQYVLTTGGEFFTVDATESVSHSWSPRTSGSVGAGLLYLLSRSRRHEQMEGTPALSSDASLLHTRPLRHGQTVAFRGASSVGSFYNPIVGAVQSAAAIVASSSYTNERFVVTVSGDATSTLVGRKSARSRVVAVALVTSYSPGDILSLQAGIRAFGQVMPEGTQASYPFQWVAFAGLGIALPTITLSR